MKILITNDDGYQANGVKTLAKIMRQFGEVTVIAPKTHQSGMSSAVSLGVRQLAHKDLGMIDGAHWHYLDATPASCIKFGLNTCFLKQRPDVVVSGINHGSNASVAACYSGTLGAAEEATLNGIPAIGVSIDTHQPEADLSAVTHRFPEIFSQLMSHLPTRRGIYYNVNFPALPEEEIKGIRAGHEGFGRWVKEFIPWDPAILEQHGIKYEMFGKFAEKPLEEGEEAWMMTGEFEDDPTNTAEADHVLVRNGYISVVAHNVFNTDTEEVRRIRSLGIGRDFRQTK